MNFQGINLALLTLASVATPTPTQMKNIAPKSTLEFFASSYYYIIPIVLILYAIGVAIFIEYELISKVKRIYYSVFILMYVAILKCVNLTGLCEKGLWGLSAKTWSVIVFSILALIAAILIDNYIISGYVFKEFGLLGAKFIKEETKQTVIEQGNYILSLEAGIQASFYTIDDIKALMKETNTIIKVRNRTFNFLDEVKKVLYLFYGYRNLDVNITVKLYDNSNMNSIINDLTQQHGLKKKERSEVQNCLTEEISFYLNREKNNYFLITTKTNEYPGKKIMLGIKSPKEINLNDQYIILNLIYTLELEVSNIR